MSNNVPRRVLEAEQRREFRELLARSSVGGPPPDPEDPALLAEVMACMDLYPDMAADMEEMDGLPLPRVPANFNATTSDGLIRVRVADFSAPPQLGATAVVFEPDDEIEASARVARINAETGLAYLDVDWDTLRNAEVADAPGNASGAEG